MSETRATSAENEALTISLADVAGIEAAPTLAPLGESEGEAGSWESSAPTSPEDAWGEEGADASGASNLDFSGQEDDTAGDLSGGEEEPFVFPFRTWEEPVRRTSHLLPESEVPDYGALELVNDPAARREEFRREGRSRRRRRVAYMLSLEVRRIVEDLELRMSLLVRVWSKMRSRQPLLNLLRCRFERVRPDDLLLLPMECMDLLDQFYRQLDEFRLYLQVTEDMPTALEIRYLHYQSVLTKISHSLLGRLNAIHDYRGLGVELPIDSAVIEED